jgi:hypothetical protein
MQPWGMDGWRVAMRAVSLVSFTVGISVALVAVDPREALRRSAPANQMHDGMISERFECD